MTEFCRRPSPTTVKRFSVSQPASEAGVTASSAHFTGDTLFFVPTLFNMTAAKYTVKTSHPGIFKGRGLCLLNLYEEYYRRFYNAQTKS